MQLKKSTKISQLKNKTMKKLIIMSIIALTVSCTSEGVKEYKYKNQTGRIKVVDYVIINSDIVSIIKVDSTEFILTSTGICKIR